MKDDLAIDGLPFEPRRIEFPAARLEYRKTGDLPVRASPIRKQLGILDVASRANENLDINRNDTFQISEYV